MITKSFTTPSFINSSSWIGTPHAGRPGAMLSCNDDMQCRTRAQTGDTDAPACASDEYFDAAFAPHRASATQGSLSRFMLPTCDVFRGPPLAHTSLG